MVLKLLHLISAGLLILSHTTFLFRALWISKKGLPPNGLDRTARFLSQALLPVTMLLGLAVYLQISGGKSFPVHGLIGLLPLTAIIGFNAIRILFKLNKKFLRMLPAINLILLLFALLTGFISRQ